MRYDAFISYRHSELDMFVAKRIHKGLETFPVPRAVAKKTGKKNIKRVFRDQEELPIGSDLGDNIEGALRESEYLIVICSPRTPESYWVQKEITTFIEMHGREHVLAVLVEGEPEESFPKELLVDDEGKPVEPLAADVRGAAKAEITKKLKTEIMRLAAPLLGCSYDDLRQRHRERRMRKMMVMAGGVAAVAVAFGAYSTYNSMLIQKNYEEKQINQSKYLADTALTLLEEGDRKTGALIALEALPSEGNNRPYVASAQYALGECLNIYNTGNVVGMDIALKHELPVRDFSYDESGERLVSVDQGGYIYVWKVENGELLTKLMPELDDNNEIILPHKVVLYQDDIIIANENGIKALAYDGTERYSFLTGRIETGAIFSIENGIGATVTLDRVVFIDLGTGSQIATLQNGREESFTTTMAFSRDGKKFAVAHFVEDAQSGVVTYFDIERENQVECIVDASFVTEIAFTENCNFVTAGYNESDFFSYEENGEIIEFVEQINGESGEVIWKNEITQSMLNVYSRSTLLKTRQYENSETGLKHEEVLLSAENIVYTWDAMDGNLISEIRLTDGIQSLLVSVTSSYGYLGDSAGKIHICDMTTGTIYSDAVVETGKEIRDVAIKNGVIAISSYASPEITFMKYQEGYGREVVAEFDSYIEDMLVSDTEKYYGISLSENEISFYETENNEYIASWLYEGDSYIAEKRFVGEIFVAVDGDGIIYFYDPATGEENVMQSEEDVFGRDVYFTQNNKYALLYGGTDYTIIDIEAKKMIAQGTISTYFYGAVLSENAEQIYCNAKEFGISILDVNSGELNAIEAAKFSMAAFSQSQSSFALNENGNILAINCSDSKLRFFDLEKMEVVDEVAFSGLNRCFLKFLQDGKHLLMQGDDYYIRVYDLEKREFCSIASQQNNEIEGVVLGEGTIVIKTLAEMLVLNASDYETIAEIEDGLAYLPEKGRVYCKYANTVYQFPYMTLEMVLEEAERQFGKDSLTEQERMKYNVD